MIFWAVTAVAAQNSIEIVVPCGADAPGLQSLIDEVSDKGGGRIVFPKGEYPTGQLELKSGVELHLEEGAVILGSTSPYDYHQVDTRQTAGDERNDKSQLGLIVAKNAHHIAITGKGVIHLLRESYPGANIVPIDYDSGSSEVNQLNRLKLMLTVAREENRRKAESEEEERSGQHSA